MRNVIITMEDLLEEKEVVRTIDISNITVPNHKAALDFEHDVVGNEEQQRKGIEAWISERGNKQHNTILELKSWEIK